MVLLVWPAGEGQRAGRGLVVAAGRGGAVGRGVADRHRHVVGGRQGDGEGERSCCPCCPSVTVTSPMLIRGSSSRMVPIALAVGDGRVGRLLRLTKNVSFGSARRSPMTSTVIVSLVWPAGMVSVPGGGLVVAAGRGACRWRWRRRR